MRADERGLRVTASVFGRVLWVLVPAIPFCFYAYAGENEWIESQADDGTGAVRVTAVLWGVFLVLFLAAMLWRFPRARLAAVGGWLLGLIPAAGLMIWGWTAL